MYRQLKDQLLEDLQAELRRMLVVARVNAHEAQQEANYHIGAMESRYDTFKEEAQYLTEAQKLRQLQLQGQLHATERLQQALRLRPEPITRVQLGALIAICSPGTNRQLCFLAPAGLNLQSATAAGVVLCVTPDTPLVRYGLGLHLGDEYPVDTQAQKIWCQIDAIW